MIWDWHKPTVNDLMEWAMICHGISNPERYFHRNHFPYVSLVVYYPIMGATRLDNRIIEVRTD